MRALYSLLLALLFGQRTHTVGIVPAIMAWEPEHLNKRQRKRAHLTKHDPHWANSARRHNGGAH